MGTKADTHVVQPTKTAGFSHMSVTANLMWDDLYMVAFSLRIIIYINNLIMYACG